MKTNTSICAITLLVTSMFAVSPVLACSLEAWDNATAGASVGEPSDGVARVAGKCAMKVKAKGQVVDNSPDAETIFFGRFYFYAKAAGAGNHTIFKALADQTVPSSELFVVTYDGKKVHLDATAAGGSKASVNADSARWNVVEFSWKSGQEGQFWVNQDAVTDTPAAFFASGTGSVDQVRLGAISGIGNKMMFFDDYKSHRSEAVGSLLAGDANGDGQVDAGDIDVIVNEYLTGDLGTGVVDCNQDAGVNSGDVNCVASGL